MPTDHDETLHERYQREAMIDERIAETLIVRRDRLTIK